MNDDSVVMWISWIVIVGVIWGVTSYLHKDSGTPHSVKKDTSADCVIPENIYSEDQEGHSMGYVWAQENSPSYCEGNSQSFNEGCNEYIRQESDYQLCLTK